MLHVVNSEWLSLSTIVNVRAMKEHIALRKEKAGCLAS